MIYKFADHLFLLRTYNESFSKKVKLTYQNKLALALQFLWDEKYHLVKSIKSFLKGDMSGADFCNLIFDLRNNIKQKIKKFELNMLSETITSFKIDENSFKFDGLLSALFLQCDVFMEE